MYDKIDPIDIRRCECRIKTTLVYSQFQLLDLFNLANCNFRDLRDVDSATLPTMTFIGTHKSYLNVEFIIPTRVHGPNVIRSTKICRCPVIK